MPSLVQQLFDFISGLGIPISLAPLASEACFLPGICIEQGGLIVDLEGLRYPGDLLHEAGHLAVVPAAERGTLNADAVGLRADRAAEEMMAMAWSYAAARYLRLDPTVVFHTDGYKGGSESLLESFATLQPVGVPMLQYVGMCHVNSAISEGKDAYPTMQRWLRE